MTFSAERLKYLEFLQTTIARQASHSFSIKGWSITVSAAVFAYTASNLSWWMALISLFPVLAFAWLDLYYLTQERSFRKLYERAIATESPGQLFNMNPRTLRGSPDHTRYRSAATSSTWWIFHLMILAVGLVLLLVAIGQVIGSAVFPNVVGYFVQHPFWC